MVKYQFWVNLVRCATELIVSRSSQQGVTASIVLCKNKHTEWVWGSINLFFSIIAAQALKEDFPLSHVISPFTNQERREGMLLNLLIPFVLTVGSGSKGLINLTKGNLSLLCFLKCQAVISYSFSHEGHHCSRSEWFKQGYLGNRGFLSFQFSYLGSRVSLLHCLGDMSFSTAKIGRPLFPLRKWY